MYRSSHFRYYLGQYCRRSVCWLCIIQHYFSKGITKLQTTYGEKLQILSTYADQILLTEQKEMQSHILQKLKRNLQVRIKPLLKQYASFQN